MRWYVSRNGETVGPVDESVVISWAKNGYSDMMVRDEYGGNWLNIKQSSFRNLLPSCKDDNVSMLDFIILLTVAILIPPAGIIIGFSRFVMGSGEQQQSGIVAMLVGAGSLFLGFLMFLR